MIQKVNEGLLKCASFAEKMKNFIENIIKSSNNPAIVL